MVMVYFLSKFGILNLTLSNQKKDSTMIDILQSSLSPENFGVAAFFACYVKKTRNFIKVLATKQLLIFFKQPVGIKQLRIKAGKAGKIRALQ